MSYKVAQVSREGYIRSCRAREYPLCVHYEMNKWVHPRIGLSLVFPKLSDALKFCREYYSPNDVIYRCRTRGLKKVLRLVSSLSEFDTVKKFWESDIYARFSRYDGTLVPSGTYGASAVMLTKRLGKANVFIVAGRNKVRPV